MQIKAKAKYIRISPRKVRLVLGLIRGMDIEEALVQLDFLKKEAAKPVKKLLESALANAVNNFNLDKSNLYIDQITADDGPTLKRWQPRAFGRATPLRKRSSHIAITLAEKVPSDDKAKVADQPVKKESDKKEKMEVVTEKPKEKAGQADTDSGEEEKGEGKKVGKGFKEKLFSRKTGM